ncbi:RabGAP/TBC [Epithele typhae]|uniref:RabGAP/TBC n=1 Tax=Epithele typhae TaxID=378194 RepID=UPI002007C4BD|nr:RabGAP/TBC [Epithele typhae]KAH9932055.1 RabGAP/TBC [Epithele typhae]
MSSYVLVVPPTPISTPGPPSPRPPPDDRALALPELTHSSESSSSTDRVRSSSETATIVTIYSMYEEENASSWSAAAASAVSQASQSRPVSRALKDSGVHFPSSKSLPAYHGSFLHQDPTSTEDSAFSDSSAYDRRSASMGKRLSVAEKSRQSMVSSNGSVQLAYAESRPPSTYRHSAVESMANGVASRRSAGSDTHRRPSGARSRASSMHKASDSQASTESKQAPLPLSLDSIDHKPLPLPPPLSPFVIPPSTVGTPVQSPLEAAYPSPSPSPTPSLGVPPSGLLSAASSPRSSSSAASIPESKHSAVVRSVGEDADAFHVRNTYAQLDQTGVRGDGYEEGVERTRARVGGSRASEIRAQQALADGSEKTRDLTPQELQLLESLDRYGFFTIPSHERLLLLAAPPLQRPLAIANTTVTSGTSSPPLLQRQPNSPTPAKETSRTGKWGRMLVPASRDTGGNIDFWGIKPSKERKIRERVYKGIPDRWRSAAWEVLMCRFSRTGKEELRQLMREYREGLDKPSSYDVQIDLDVPRTISGHVMFRTRYGQGQRSLFHVLHVLSLRCEACGYCQGMGPLAATLLNYFEPERAYASLVHIHDAYNMHSIFSPGFPGLLEAIYVQERLTEQMIPPVYAAFKKHTVSTTSYATKWYITLFANSVPFQMQLRLWDAFLLEGHDLFVIVALAIVWVYRDYITSATANFETILSLLSSFFVPENEDSVMFWIEKALRDPKIRSDMTGWRQDWAKLVESGEQHSALL